MSNFCHYRFLQYVPHACYYFAYANNNEQKKMKFLDISGLRAYNDKVLNKIKSLSDAIGKLTFKVSTTAPTDNTANNIITFVTT